MLKRAVCVAVVGGCAFVALSAARPVPRPAMKARLAADIDVIGIVHWGLNTWTDREWGYGDEDPRLLNPSAFDADAIVAACKAGGLKGLVVVAKHHDGFCLWPTKTTDHNISKSPFRDGKGDYVREMSDACRRAGLKFGVYCSPWDRNSPHYGTAKYVELYHAQIKELLSGAYGDVFEMWFDGANGGDGWYGGAKEVRRIGVGYYRFDTVFDFVRTLQPGVTIFAGEEDASDLRWPGNERGILDPESRATITSVGGYANGEYGNPDYAYQINTGMPSGSHFRVCEADFPLRRGWFYHARDCGTTKNAAYLTKRYLSSVGNGGVMNIGIAPDRDGRMDPADVEALKGFGALREALFAHEVTSEDEPFNVVVLSEDLSQGEQVDHWIVKADGKFVCDGRAIGHRRIRVLKNDLTAGRLELLVTSDGGVRQEVSVRRYRADRELLNLIAGATDDSGETDTAKWMTGKASKLSVSAGNLEVVIEPDAPKTVRFAAQEATNFLSRVLGAPVAVVTAPTEDKTSLVLGDTAWSRAAGVDIAKLPRDGFVIRTAGSRVFVAGRDDAKADPATDVRNGSYGNLMYERATLFGVYEFLERFADCRFFFPGKCGEIVPRREAIEVPETDLVRAPHFTSRDPYFGGDGAWYEDEGFGDQRGRSRGKALNWLRLRMDTERVPCCHGQQWNMIRERFSESHPEYFQMRKDGTRCTGYPKPGEAAWNFNQLCQSSGIWDVFYEDAKAYLSGKDAASRGVPSRWDRKKFAWNGNFSGRYVDVMCQDAFHECFCPACQKAYDKSSKHYARDLVWGRTAKLAQRLKDDGFDAVVSQMSYPPYGEVPSFDLPDNVLVTVAQQGPWGVRNRVGFESQLAMYRDWFEKTKRRVRTWTYAHKYGKTNIPGIPCVAPRAYGEYWKAAAPYVCGGFLETESERSIHHYFNYYVFSKIAWDPKTDVEALIADHHEKMFGKGAAAMTEFYGLLEDTWINEIAGNVKETIYGPQAVVPSEYDIWTKVYSPAFVARLAALCDRAMAAVGADTSEAKRIAFIRKHYLEPLKESAAAYKDAISVSRGLKERARRPNRTLLTNGDFDEGLKDWEVCEGGEVAFDETTKVTGRGSVRLTSTERAEVKQYLNADFKPGKKYRITFFIKTKDIRPVKGEKGGVYVEFYDGWWQFFPKSDYRGTMDWMYQEWTMTSSQAKPGDKLFIHLLMNGVSGTAWFDDVRVEPVEE